MLENEDSVVTSLNELRKLKHERITRQTQSRAVVGSGRAAALAVDPVADQMTPPPVSVPSVGAAGLGARESYGDRFPARPAFGGLAAPAEYMSPPPPVIQVRTSYKAAVIMTVLLLGAAGAGYVALQNNMQAQLAEKDERIKRAEQDQSRAAGALATAEVQARNNLRQCEDKLKTALAAPAPAAAPSAPAALPSTPAVVERKPEKPVKVATRAAKSKPVARSARRVAASAEPAAPKSEDVPKIAKKKKLDNDPLAGLGKL
jgi:hypothetical protein